MRHVLVGWDKREPQAYAICKHSLNRHSSVPLDIFPIMEMPLRLRKMFDRPQANYVDERDGKPFSTDFSFTRFAVPEICRKNGITGWVLYCDCDFLFLTDVEELFQQYSSSLFDQFAVCVVKHQYDLGNSIKMDGRKQESYNRKLWSSLILFNISHPANAKLGDHEVNHWAGADLHGFKWLKDEEIGWISESWNWIPQVSPTLERRYRHNAPKAIHFSLGTPNMPGYENQPWADVWRAEYEHLIGPSNNKRISI